VLTVISPPDGSYTDDPRIEISGKAVDGTSGVDPATVQIALDGAPVSTTYDRATGVASHVPAADLPEKWIEVTLSARLVDERPPP
jgi:hypothetical protein